MRTWIVYIVLFLVPLLFGIGLPELVRQLVRRDRMRSRKMRVVMLMQFEMYGRLCSQQIIRMFAPYGWRLLPGGGHEEYIQICREAHIASTLRWLVQHSYVSEGADGYFDITDKGSDECANNRDNVNFASRNQSCVAYHPALHRAPVWYDPNAATQPAAG